MAYFRDRKSYKIGQSLQNKSARAKYATRGPYFAQNKPALLEFQDSYYGRAGKGKLFFPFFHRVFFSILKFLRHIVYLEPKIF